MIHSPIWVLTHPMHSRGYGSCIIFLIITYFIPYTSIVPAVKFPEFGEKVMLVVELIIPKLPAHASPTALDIPEVELEVDNEAEYTPLDKQIV